MKLPLTEIGPPLTAADLEAFEARVRVNLPDDYRAFLLATNGGVVNGEDEDGKWPDEFSSVRPAGSEPLEELDIEEAIDGVRNGEVKLPDPRLLPIASGLGGSLVYFLSCGEPDAGEVFKCDFANACHGDLGPNGEIPPARLKRVAKTFTAFAQKVAKGVGG